MVPRVKEVVALDGYRLWLRFHDGLAGTVNLSAELWGPMFDPLRDMALFLQAAVHPELETVTWPNGADLAPEILYRAAQESLATETLEAARA